MQTASYCATGGVGAAEDLGTGKPIATERGVVRAPRRVANPMAIPTPTRASSPAWAGDQKVTGR